VLYLPFAIYDLVRRKISVAALYERRS